jgi:hypothetical protein
MNNNINKCYEANVFIKDKFGVKARLENKATKCLQLNG